MEGISITASLGATQIEFAFIIIVLASILFLRELLYTSGLERPSYKRAVNIVIIPLFILFIVNLAIILVG